MPQRSIRFSDCVLKEVDTVWRTRGFASPPAFIRYAVKQELSERQEGLTGAEERIAATLIQVRKDVFRTSGSEAASGCIRQRAIQRLIKNAGRAMVGESKLAMEDLVGDLDRP